MRKLFVILPFYTLLIWPFNFCWSQSSLSNPEKTLFDKINEIRKQNKLKSLPFSKSLAYVAKTHVNDLEVNHPDTSICSTASWTANAKWSSCCYCSYVPNNECMWNKPKELTNYPYRGYELSYYQEDSIDIDTVFHLLESTSSASDMLLTKGNYKSFSWEAMGLSVGNNYVCIWFGQRPDIYELKDEAILQHAYYLIVASTTNRKDAENHVKKLRKNNFPDASIIQTDKRYRVAIASYNSMSEAEKASKKLKNSYSDIWIFQK